MSGVRGETSLQIVRSILAVFGFISELLMLMLCTTAISVSHQKRSDIQTKAAAFVTGDFCVWPSKKNEGNQLGVLSMALQTDTI